MTKTITLDKDALIALQPCGLDQRITMFGKRKRMNVKQALEAGFTVSDVLWVAGQLGLKEKCVEFAIRCAREVQHLNTDPRVNAAIDAAQAWLDVPSDSTAARAAYAADAAYAARAAARAAYAAYAAAYATAADAARAAYAAADAARAADAAKQKEILLSIFMV